MTATTPMTHATSRDCQRNLHMPLATASAWSINSSMGSVQSMKRATSRSGPRLLEDGHGARPQKESEEALGDDQHIARLHFDVRGDVAALDQILQAHGV